MYILRYPEEKPVQERGGEPWSIRQSAFYHQIRKADQRSIFILISPLEDSTAENRLEMWCRSCLSAASLRATSFGANEVLLQHLDAWRVYLRYYENCTEKFVRVNCQTLYRHDSTLTASQHEKMSLFCGRELDCVSARDMAQSSHLERKIACVDIILMSVQDVLCGLEAILTRQDQIASSAVTFGPFASSLRARMADIAACQRYARAVLNKAAASSRLLDGLLDFRHQSIAHALSNATVDDSATVRVLTTITVVYLSSMAVAVCTRACALATSQR